MRTGWSAIGTPWPVVYSPWIVTDRPYGTRSVVVTWTWCGAQCRWTRHVWGPVLTRVVVHGSMYLTTLTVLRWPPRLTRTSWLPRRIVTQCQPTRTRLTTTSRRIGLTIFVRLTCWSDAIRSGSVRRSVVVAQFPTLSHETARKS